MGFAYQMWCSASPPGNCGQHRSACRAAIGPAARSTPRRQTALPWPSTRSHKSSGLLTCGGDWSSPPHLFSRLNGGRRPARRATADTVTPRELAKHLCVDARRSQVGQRQGVPTSVPVFRLYFRCTVARSGSVAFCDGACSDACRRSRSGSLLKVWARRSVCTAALQGCDTRTGNFSVNRECPSAWLLTRNYPLSSSPQSSQKSIGQ